MQAPKVKVLLAEDDLSLGYVIKDNLVDAGYEVILCPDGQSAIDKFDKDEFGMCLLDVMMPNKDGFAVAKKIRQQSDMMPIIFITARAMEECLITVITRKAMLAALRKEPRFSELFVSYLVTRSNRIEEDLIDQLFNSSEKRLARLLLLLANFGKNGKPTSIDASINQGTLAEMIGTTRSRVSFFLNKFRKLGLISYNGKIEVHRSLLNAVLYEKPQLERDEKPIP